MIANYDVTIAPRRWTEPGVQVPRYRTNSAPHIRRQNKPLVNLWLPIPAPIAAFIVVKGIVMIPVPVAGRSAVAVVEVVMVMMVSVVIAILTWRQCDPYK